ncbi:MAG: MBL fold metallo-hydrolase [Proteobacteria bacterium]|nr:MBL fold metallo-hydrolase [Pseudomonadota bacterium]
MMNLNLDYDRAIKIAENVYWVGFFDTQSGLHCNPYLIIDGDEAVVIDSGSRPHFPVVMMKILQTGIDPSSISALIYQHYDPDLCGNIPNFEDLIAREDLKIISDANNNMFIRHYSVTSKLYALDPMEFCYTFSSGRRLTFHSTPYCHSTGSFVTFDEQSGILFTSDLFGSFGGKWELFLELTSDCHGCRAFQDCPRGRSYCPLPDILKFHQTIMPSERALRYALERISAIPCAMLAPQHGSIIHKPEDIVEVTKQLAALEDVGIDGVLGERSYASLGDVSAVEKRLQPDDQ